MTGETGLKVNQLKTGVYSKCLLHMTRLWKSNYYQVVFVQERFLHMTVLQKQLKTERQYVTKLHFKRIYESKEKDSRKNRPTTVDAFVTTAYVIITVYVISTACVIKNQLLM